MHALLTLAPKWLPTARSSTRTATYLLAAVAATGCALVTPRTPEEQVALLAKERWAALVKRDFAKAWTFAEPSVRAEVAQEDYRQRFGAAATWQDAEVKDVICEAAQCTVTVYVKSKMIMAPWTGHDISGNMHEVWVRDDGGWWFRQPN